MNSLKLIVKKNSIDIHRESTDVSAWYILVEAVQRFNEMLNNGVVFYHHTQASNKMVADVIDYENAEQDSMKLSMLETLIADALIAGNMLPTNVQSVEDEEYLKEIGNG